MQKSYIICWNHIIIIIYMYQSVIIVIFYVLWRFDDQLCWLKMIFLLRWAHWRWFLCGVLTWFLSDHSLSLQDINLSDREGGRSETGRRTPSARWPRVRTLTEMRASIASIHHATSEMRLNRFTAAFLTAALSKQLWTTQSCTRKCSFTFANLSNEIIFKQILSLQRCNGNNLHF